MPHRTAVLYRGTGCSKSFMKKVAKELQRFGFKKRKISNRCWIKTGRKTFPHLHFKADIRYWHIKHFNIKKGNFDLVAGHSAGGFPAALTKGKIKIGFNPFFTQYPFLDVIFHAKDDWLVLVDRPRILKAQKLILYEGDHSTFPEKEFRDWLRERFATF